MLENAFWIVPPEDYGPVAPVFIRRFTLERAPMEAYLSVTAAGVYEARLNGQRIGRFVMAPGWTSYNHRLQVQRYDVTGLLQAGENLLEITVAKGWYHARRVHNERPYRFTQPALIAALTVDGTELATDETWSVRRSALRLCEIYDGELYDATAEEPETPAAVLPQADKSNLIPEEGEEIIEQERLRPRACFVTPKGERVIDFGQNIAGYVSFRLRAQAGDRVRITHFEELDRDGNVYTEHYRSAKATLTYICRDGEQQYHTTHTYYGFRRIRIDEWPGELNPDDFEAVVIGSDVKRTGWIESSDPRLNRLYESIVWGVRGGWIDTPVDSPNRDERLGWLGDAQLYCSTGCYNFDGERFFRKWFADIRAEQLADGSVSRIVPGLFSNGNPNADTYYTGGWSDATVICPWQVYLTYGDSAVLAEHYGSVRRWLDSVAASKKEGLRWPDGEQFVDWCSLDKDPEQMDVCASDKDFLVAAYYLNSLRLAAKMGTVLGETAAAEEYRRLSEETLAEIRRLWPELHTQTEYVFALHFDIAEDKAAAAAALAKLIRENGNRLTTGFAGTAYLLQALTRNGYNDLAYELLLREEYPSWLYMMRQGGTTIWEHWNARRPDGSFWSPVMNSFNHPALGVTVGAWAYEDAAGIRPVEEAPGFERVVIAPHPDRRLSSFGATLDTRRGRIVSRWSAFEGGWRYEITTPSPAEIILGERHYSVTPGSYVFFG